MLPRNRRLTAGLNRYSEVRKFRKNRALAGGTVLGQLMCGPEPRTSQTALLPASFSQQVEALDVCTHVSGRNLANGRSRFS